MLIMRIASRTYSTTCRPNLHGAEERLFRLAAHGGWPAGAYLGDAQGSRIRTRSQAVPSGSWQRAACPAPRLCQWLPETPRSPHKSFGKGLAGSSAPATFTGHRTWRRPMTAGGLLARGVLDIPRKVHSIPQEEQEAVRAANERPQLCARMSDWPCGAHPAHVEQSKQKG